MFSGFFYYYGGVDGMYLLILLAFVLCLFASSGVNATFKRYSKVRAACGMTGAEVAQRLLHQAGIYDVGIEHCSGNLTDHYNPKHKTLALSDSVYSSRSVSAICVAAHECGHAIQHELGYAPLKLRTGLAPVVSFCSHAYMPVFLLGCLLTRFGGYYLILAGILLFALLVFFQLVTLPVEFDASRRAMRELERQGILSRDEVDRGRKVLRAAALTYVASALMSVLQLLRLIGIGRRRRD